MNHINTNVSQFKTILKSLCNGNENKYKEVLEFLKEKRINIEDTQYNDSLINFGNNIIELTPRYNNQYLQLKMIGRGGFGSVYAAQYYLDKNIYAIKKIPIYDTEISYMDNYISEILILSRLEHNNIVRYYTSWVETYNDQDNKNSINNLNIDNNKSLPIEYSNSLQRSISYSSLDSISTNTEPIINLYIQMELCKHYSLADIIQNISFKESINIIKGIIDGVEYLHSKNIVHRDIKPKNILFSLNNKKIKLADFGLSCLEHENVRKSSSLGTVLYKDPHGSYSDKTVDIYSLGVVITELLCSFDTRMERIETLKRLKHMRIPEYLDSNIKEVISKCIHINIKDRYTIDELKKIINKIVL